MELSDAAGDVSMGNWQGWIFNEEQAATQKQQGGQRASISSTDSHRRLIHQTPRWAVLSLNSPGTPTIPRLLPLCPSSLYCLSISPTHSGSTSTIFTLYFLQGQKQTWSVKFGTQTWGGWFMWNHFTQYSIVPWSLLITLSVVFLSANIGTLGNHPELSAPLRGSISVTGASNDPISRKVSSCRQSETFNWEKPQKACLQHRHWALTVCLGWSKCVSSWAKMHRNQIKSRRNDVTGQFL